MVSNKCKEIYFEISYVSGYGLSHHRGDNVLGSRIAQLVEYLPC